MPKYAHTNGEPRVNVFLWMIGLVYYTSHPQPPQLNWARVYCGCQPGPTRVALHPGRVVKEPERQPYVHWTTCYDFEVMRNKRAVLLQICMAKLSSHIGGAFTALLQKSADIQKLHQTV